MLDTRGSALLEGGLAANTWFCRISGIAMAALSPWLADFAGIHTWLLVVLGLALVAYSLWLGAVASRRPINRVDAVLAIAGDLAWVVAAAVITFGFPSAISTGARWVLGIVSLGVLGFGVAQTLGLMRESAG